MTQPLFKDKYRVKSSRLPNRDYGANGYYFVTICTRDRLHFFGDIVVETLHCNISPTTDRMQLSPIGKIAQQFWLDIPNHFTHTYIDAYVIMPNHIHGIIVINRPSNGNYPTDNNDDCSKNVETLQCNVSTPTSAAPASLYTPTSASPHTPRKDPQREFMSQISPKAGSLGTIVRSHKSIVSRCCHQNGLDNFGWQPRFYEHIIRADESLDQIRQYIHNNPVNWAKGSKNCPNLWM